MILFKFLLFALFSLTALSLPIGHEAGFLGNTTSRPGDIGASLTFPSATAFMDHDEIRIYFGLVYTRQDIEVEDTGSKFENQFIPYFTGFATELFGITFTNFITYSGTNNGSLSFSQDSIEGTAFIQAEETVMGISAAKVFNDYYSLGLSLSLDIQSSRSFTSASGNTGGNDYVASIQETGKYIFGKAVVSTSFKNKGHFLSLSLSFPGVRFSSKQTTKSLILVDGSPAQNVNTSSKPKLEQNFGLSFGYSYLNSSWKPSIEIYNDLKPDDLKIATTNDNERESAFADSYNLKFGLESPETRFKKLFSGTNVSYLFGIQLSESVRDDITTEGTTKTSQYSVGVKLTSKNTSPIFGIYYSDQKSDTRSSVFGLMYSSNYNIFD